MQKRVIGARAAESPAQDNLCRPKPVGLVQREFAVGHVFSAAGKTERGTVRIFVVEVPVRLEVEIAEQSSGFSAQRFGVRDPPISGKNPCPGDKLPEAISDVDGSTEKNNESAATRAMASGMVSRIALRAISGYPSIPRVMTAIPAT